MSMTIATQFFAEKAKLDKTILNNIRAYEWERPLLTSRYTAEK